MRRLLAVVVLVLLATTAAAQTMTVDPAHPIVIEAPLNADPPSSFMINITADRTTNWIVTGLPKWLKADASFGRTPATVTFTVTPPGKVVGASYGATLLFTNLRTRLGDTARAIAVEVAAEESKPSPNATWRLDGTMTPASFTDVGTVLRFAYVATNTGDAVIAGATLLPTVDVNCPSGDLKPGEMLSCTFEHAVMQADLDAGRVLETTKLQSLDATPPMLQMPLTSVYMPPPKAENATWRIENITPTPTSYFTPDQQLGFSFKLTNLGQEPVTGANIHAASASNICGEELVLTPGGSAICGVSYVVTQGDLDAGALRQSAVAFNNPGWTAGLLRIDVSAAYTPPYLLLCGDEPCLDDKGGRLVTP